MGTFEDTLMLTTGHENENEKIKEAAQRQFLFFKPFI